jgi:hypothetical protein
LNEAFDRRSIDLLLMIDRLGEISRIYGDRVAVYAPLVASDLVSISLAWTHLSSSMGEQL